MGDDDAKSQADTLWGEGLPLGRRQLNVSHDARVALRADGAAGEFDIARIFMKAGTEDAIGGVDRVPTQLFSFSDFAILADLNNQKYDCQHGDVIQGRSIMGDSTVRRGFIEHAQKRVGAAPAPIIRGDSSDVTYAVSEATREELGRGAPPAC